MEKSIAKFLSFLKYVDEALRRVAIEDYGKGLSIDSPEIEEYDRRLREVSNFTRFLTVKRNYQDNHGEIFADFDILSEFLDASDLNYRDKYNLILYFIKKNCKSGILDKPALLVSLKDIEKTDLPQDVKDFIVDLITSDKINGFLNVGNVTYSGFELEVYNIIKTFCVDLSFYKDTTLAMKEHYIDKLSSGITEEDALVVRESLGKMGVSDSSLEAFMYAANRKIVKPEIIISKPSPVYTDDKDSNLISEKEFKIMKKHIKTTFDTYNRVLLRNISYDEMIYTAYLMYRLSYPEYDIINLFRACMKGKFLDVYTIADFKNETDKFKYYMSEEEFDTVIEYLKEAETGDTEAYYFWNSEAAKIIRQVSLRFSSKYDYEMSLVKKFKIK